MRKIYLIGLVLIGSLSANAQNANTTNNMTPKVEKISLQESSNKVFTNVLEKGAGDLIVGNQFDVPADWAISAADVQGQWQIVTTNPTTPANFAGYVGTMTSTTASNGFAVFNGIQYLVPGPPLAQNAKITMVNPIDFSANPNVTLSFEQGYRPFNSDQCWVEFSTDGGTVWSGFEVNTQYPVNAPYIQNKVVANVSSYIGGQANALIRFRWTSANANSGYGWMIDDLKFTESLNDEVEVYEVFIGDIVQDFSYSIVPVEQTAPMVIGVALENIGVNVFNDNVNISIKLNGAEVSNFNQMVTLPSSTKDTVWITSAYTASTVGNYTVVATIPADDIPSNNSDSSSISTSQYIWAHDFGGNVARGFDENEAYAIGNLFLPVVNGQLSAVNINFAAGTTPNQEVEIAVYELTTPSVQQPLIFITEQYYTVVAANISAPFTTIEFFNPVTLVAGKTYLMYVKKTTGTNRLYVSGSAGDNDYGTVCYGPFGAGAAVNWYNGFTWAPHIRANFDPSLAIQNVSLLDGISVYPNPSEGIITITNDNNIENTIIVFDLTGKKVASKVSSSTTTLDLSSMGTGVYMVEVSNQNGKKLERVIIK